MHNFVTKTKFEQAFSTKSACCLQLLVFLKTKESLTITLVWHRRPYLSPKGCCHHELNESTEKMAKLSFIGV